MSMKRVVNGLLVIDKPSGITSRDAVNRAQQWFPRRTKTGHTGTLDPLATGVLVVCLGSATRLAAYVQDMDKDYRTRIMLGARSDTDDADGTIAPAAAAGPIDETTVRESVAGFVGEIAQSPPAYSAVKIDGKRAHDLARRGGQIEIAPRNVKIYSIEILGYRWPELELEIHCGKGTYIRSLARDLGEKLGCGAYVTQLRRTRVGPFLVESGVSLDESVAAVDRLVLPPRAAVGHMPAVIADESAIDQFRHGQCFVTPGVSPSAAGTEFAIIDAEESLVGIGIVDKSGGIWPLKNFRGE